MSLWTRVRELYRFVFDRRAELGARGAPRCEGLVEHAHQRPPGRLQAELSSTDPEYSCVDRSQYKYIFVDCVSYPGGRKFSVDQGELAELVRTMAARNIDFSHKGTETPPLGSSELLSSRISGFLANEGASGSISAQIELPATMQDEDAAAVVAAVCVGLDTAHRAAGGSGLKIEDVVAQSPAHVPAEVE